MRAIRIQRSRAKGWRMPEGAVYVGRPSAFGNPFALDCWGAVALGFRGDAAGRRAASVALHRWWMTSVWTPQPIDAEGGAIEFSNGVVVSIETHIRRLAAAVAEGYLIPEMRPDVSGLRGRDLACWCPLDQQPCHADVLLELANPEGAS